jgi:uncharacterized protein
MVSLQSFYPKHWPPNPFHAGEVMVQQKLGVHDHVMGYAPRVVRPYMPDQHVDFFSAQPFLVVAARDEADRMWSTLIFMENHGQSDPDVEFVSSSDPTRLSIPFQPLLGDALEHAFQPGSDVGILGIEFATRRRNRVNGRLLNSTNSSKALLEFKVDQSFGNCPQYIQPREWWTRRDADTPSVQKQSPKRSQELSNDQIAAIRQADTIFVASGYRGEGEDPRFGNDASHRGGSPGFLRAQGRSKLLLPDYSGNNHYNTIGNLVMDSRMGITIPLFETGGMIQVTGRAAIQWDEDTAAAQFPGARRVIELSIDEVLELPAGSFPITFTTKNIKQVQVVEKIKESDDITSFYFAAVPGDAPELPPFEAGQYLPLEFSIGDGDRATRTYSLSNSNDQSEYYRISVQRDPFGLVSRHLHDNVQPGDILDVQRPTGEFVYKKPEEGKIVVFLSAGIGVTPILSMLHKFVRESSSSSTKAIWIHSARNARQHAFRDEVKGLQQLAGNDKLKTHIIYTRPKDIDHGLHDSSKRLDADVLKSIVGDPSKAVFYLCGGSSFAAEMESTLQKEGVRPSNIHYESF